MEPLGLEINRANFVQNKRKMREKRKIMADQERMHFNDHGLKNLTVHSPNIKVNGKKRREEGEKPNPSDIRGWDTSEDPYLFWFIFRFLLSYTSSNVHRYLIGSNYFPNFLNWRLIPSQFYHLNELLYCILDFCDLLFLSLRLQTHTSCNLWFNTMPIKCIIWAVLDTFHI